MKVAIISDIHDNITNLKTCLRWCKAKKVDKILCLGDLTNEDTLKKLASFDGEIFLIRGNAEIYDSDKIALYKNINYLGKTGVAQVDKIRVGLCHESYNSDKINKKDLKVIFYGHSHRPWIEDKKGIKFVNPGTLGGVFTGATFAFWDMEKANLELVNLFDIDKNL